MKTLKSFRDLKNLMGKTKRKELSLKRIEIIQLKKDRNLSFGHIQKELGIKTIC